MESDDLTNAQAWQLDAQLRPMLDYLFKLRCRMDSAGFPPDDPLVCEVQQALDATRLLIDRVRLLAIRGTGYAGGRSPPQPHNKPE